MDGLLVGGIASAFHDFFITPADGKIIGVFLVIKQRLQLVSNYRFKECARDLIRKEGPISLFRSLPITIVLFILNCRRQCRFLTLAL